MSGDTIKPLHYKSQSVNKDYTSQGVKKQNTPVNRIASEPGKKEIPPDPDTICVSQGHAGKNETPAEVKNHKTLSGMKNTWDVKSDKAIVECVRNTMNEESERKDLSSLINASEVALKAGGKAFEKFESADVNQKGEKDEQIKAYKDPDEGKDDIKKQWADSSKETDQARVYKETHKVMEKLQGQDKSEEKADNADGSHTEKTYETTQKKTGEETELSFKEDHKTTSKDGKDDISSSTTKRNPDGTYNKEYERTDKDGNMYKTELDTNFDGSSERKSETIMKSGTKITSTESTDANGNKKIISDEIKPDGTKVHKEVSVNGKEKVDGTKPDTDNKIDKPDGNNTKITGQKPPEIDRSKLTKTDNAIIDALHLDKMNPGDKMKLSAKTLADLGLGAQLNEYGISGSVVAGGNVQYTLERDRNNPNCYRIAGGGELLGGIKADGGTVGLKAGDKVLAGFGGNITLEMDFSKKGEVTNTALFAARSMIQTAADTSARAVPGPGNVASSGVSMLDKADTLAENLGTDLLPGDSSLKFMHDHFKSIEVQGGIGAEFSSSLGECLGLDNKITEKLAAGGKLERRTDPQTGKTVSWDVTGSISGTADINSDVFAGNDALKLKTKAGNLHGGISLEETFHFPVDENGKLDAEKINSDIALKLNVGGEIHTPSFMAKDVKDSITTGGIEFKGSASLKNILNSMPDEYRNEMKEAIEQKDYKKVQDICLKVLPNVKFDGKVETFERTNLEAKGKLSAKDGVGGGVEGSAGMDYVATRSSYEGSLTLDSKGIHTKGSHYENGIKDQGGDQIYDISWEEFAGKLEEAPGIVDSDM